PFGDLPPIHAVLITHNHYDHLDVETIQRLWRRDRPFILAPLGNDAIIRRRIPDIPVETRDWGGMADLGGGLACHMLPAHHWSARGLNDRRMALWAAFLIETPDGPFYHVGDTGFGDGSLFRDVRARF